MKKVAVVPVVCMCITCGCDKARPAVELDAAGRARSLIISLTNATPRTITLSEAVRTNLLAMADVDARQKMLVEWTQALLNVDVQGLAPSVQVNNMIAVGRVLDDAVLWYMQDAGKSYVECWEVRFEQLRRLDEALLRLDPALSRRSKTMRDEMVKWQVYRALVEYRERLIEKHECNGLYRKAHKISDTEYESIRMRLEKCIGRSIRPEKDIRVLGTFVKVAGLKVLAREKAALKKYRLQKGD